MDFSEAVRRMPYGAEADRLVSPGSDRSALEGIDPWRKRIIVRVRAKPTEGKANKEVEELISGITGCRSEVIRGHTSRQKTVAVYGDTDSIIASVGEAV